MIAVAGDDIIMTGPGRFHDTMGAGFLARIKMQESADFTFHISFITPFFKTPGI
jgi:hypothetical protein